MSEQDQDEIATGPAPVAPMSKEAREQFAYSLRKQLDSRRDVFVVGKHMFEQTEGSSAPDRIIAPDDDGESKRVSAATLRLLLDYCESAWDMDFVSYCAGIFHGRAPQPGECAFDLLPDVQSRISADRLGFGAIYGTGNST